MTSNDNRTRPIPDCPGYRVTRQGEVTGPCGFALAVRKGRVALWLNKKTVNRKVAELTAAAWPEPKASTPEPTGPTGPTRPETPEPQPLPEAAQAQAPPPMPAAPEGAPLSFLPALPPGATEAAMPNKPKRHRTCDEVAQEVMGHDPEKRAAELAAERAAEKAFLEVSPKTFEELAGPPVIDAGPRRHEQEKAALLHEVDILRNKLAKAIRQRDNLAAGRLLAAVATAGGGSERLQ